ncbi:bifunctional DNA primase/polymerase [Microbacterium sp. 22296]|uniref:bifunctional DNA primase/polymerase n=1 Tax=Microbacterium sp. 22296 TaxID=3453903 RepID=UPI003F863A6F
MSLHNARNGYPGFVVRPDKTPFAGETAWESRATINEHALNRMFDLHPDGIPAVAPGVAHLTVIDVDRKPGKPDGLVSLAQYDVDLMANGAPSFPSISGLGTHHWFAGTSTSVNHVLPGVDRKSGGGYVVVPYLLPPAQTITATPPPILRGGKVGTQAAAESSYRDGSRTWLAENRTGRTLSHAVARSVRPLIAGESFAGHEAMLRFQIHLVKLATEGHPGVPEALEFARGAWLDTPHSSAEDPAREWDVALDRAIAKYGGTRP